MLPAHARLTESKGFKAVYGRGRSGATDLIVVYVLPRRAILSPSKDQSPSKERTGKIRIGFTAGKKVGGAVERNRAKRLMREAARALLPNISGSYDIVIVARKKIGEATLHHVRADLERLLKRAGALSMPEE